MQGKKPLTRRISKDHYVSYPSPGTHSQVTQDMQAAINSFSKQYANNPLRTEEPSDSISRVQKTAKIVPDMFSTMLMQPFVQKQKSSKNSSVFKLENDPLDYIPFLDDSHKNQSPLQSDNSDEPKVKIVIKDTPDPLTSVQEAIRSNSIEKFNAALKNHGLAIKSEQKNDLLKFIAQNGNADMAAAFLVHNLYYISNEARRDAVLEASKRGNPNIMAVIMATQPYLYIKPETPYLKEAVNLTSVLQNIMSDGSTKLYRAYHEKRHDPESIKALESDYTFLSATRINLPLLMKETICDRGFTLSDRDKGEALINIAKNGNTEMVINLLVRYSAVIDSKPEAIEKTKENNDVITQAIILSVFPELEIAANESYTKDAVDLAKTLREIDGITITETCQAMINVCRNAKILQEKANDNIGDVVEPTLENDVSVLSKTPQIDSPDYLKRILQREDQNKSAVMHL